MNDALLRILVVDDDDINRIILKKIFSKDTCLIFDAENGEEALKILEKKEIDVVLMDIYMPVLDGIETIKIIRGFSDEYYQQLPVIALTASISFDEIKEESNNGFTSYESKPFNIESLKGKVSNYSNQKISLF